MLTPPEAVPLAPLQLHAHVPRAPDDGAEIAHVLGVTDDVHKNGFTQEYLMKGMTKEKEVVAS